MNWLYWELWVGYELIVLRAMGIRRLWKYFLHILFFPIQTQPNGTKEDKIPKFELSNFSCNFNTKFWKCSSLWVTYDSLKKLSSSFCCQYPKFCIFGRYTQFLFFNLLWCSFHLIDYDKRVVVFKATFNNISVILWWSVFLVEETGAPRENHQASGSVLTDFLYRICIFS